jgi:hypothetical protein
VRASAFRIGTLLVMSAVRRVLRSREPLAPQLQQHRGGSGRRGGFRGGRIDSANAWPARAAHPGTGIASVPEFTIIFEEFEINAEYIAYAEHFGSPSCPDPPCKPDPPR